MPKGRWGIMEARTGNEVPALSWCVDDDGRLLRYQRRAEAEKQAAEMESHIQPVFPHVRFSVEPVDELLDELIWLQTSDGLTIAVPDATCRWYRAMRYDTITLTINVRALLNSASVQ
jgi:hypothetical protein